MCYCRLIFIPLRGEAMNNVESVESCGDTSACTPCLLVTNIRFPLVERDYCRCCRENNRIKIWNNGKGIPVVEHKDEKMYVPTLIFGHLLTSSNYNDFERKVTGERPDLLSLPPIIHSL